MKAKELVGKGWYFRYKGRRWYASAYLPWLDKVEIHTLTGDRCSTIEPETEVQQVSRILRFY